MTNLSKLSDRELSEAVWSAKNLRELNRLEAEQARRLSRVSSEPNSHINPIFREILNSQLR